MEVELEGTFEGDSSGSASSGEGSDVEYDVPITATSSTGQAQAVQADGAGSWTSGGPDTAAALSTKHTSRKKKRASDYPVDCHVCRKTFQSRRSLVRHFKRFHAGAEYPKPQVIRVDEKGEVVLVPSEIQEAPASVGLERQTHKVHSLAPKTTESTTMKRLGDNVDVVQPIKRQQAEQHASGANGKPESADMPPVTNTTSSPMLTSEEVTALKIFRLGQLCEALLIDVCLADSSLSGSSKSFLSSSSLSSASGVEGIAVFTPLQMHFLQTSGYS